MRRTIATRLSEAKREIPHFYLEATCAAEALMDVRRKLNEDTDSTRLSVNDFCVAAAARALRDVPEANWGHPQPASSERPLCVPSPLLSPGGLADSMAALAWTGSG